MENKPIPVEIKCEDDHRALFIVRSQGKDYYYCEECQQYVIKTVEQ